MTHETHPPLPREFYLQPALQAAPQLLGKQLIHQTEQGCTAGIIVEVEAYLGPEDQGAHSYGGRHTPRTHIQFGPGGYAYVYAIYGMHCCFNVVTNGPDKPEVVLIRALEPTAGLEQMAARRGTEEIVSLCSGPGKLCQAMDITKAQYGADLCGSALWIAPGIPVETEQILVSPRINIDYAGAYRDRLWRYFIRDNAFVSAVAAKYRQQTLPCIPIEQ